MKKIVDIYGVGSTEEKNPTVFLRYIKSVMEIIVTDE